MPLTRTRNAIDNAQKRLAPYIEKGMVTFIRIFRHLRLQEAGVQEIDGICYGKGVSPQLDQRERGFS